FLITISQTTIRLYSGFRYGKQGNATKTPKQGLLKAAATLDQAMAFLKAFHARRIDDGSMWNVWGKTVTPETRVDWSLLSELNDLDAWLQSHGIDDPKVSHSLICNYVYF